MGAFLKYNAEQKNSDTNKMLYYIYVKVQK